MRENRIVRKQKAYQRKNSAGSWLCEKQGPIFMCRLIHVSGSEEYLKPTKFSKS